MLTTTPRNCQCLYQISLGTQYPNQLEKILCLYINVRSVQKITLIFLSRCKQIIAATPETPKPIDAYF